MGATKTYKCIVCGCDVEATKFASAKKIRCEEHKDASVYEPDPKIMEEIIDNSPTKSRAKKHTGDTKQSKCIQCGVEVTVTKFASHKKTLCDKCKGTTKSSNYTDGELPKIDLSKINMGEIFDPDNVVLPQVIRNKSLRQLECPACGDQKHMRIVKIADGGKRGLVIHYQCQNEKCNTYIVLSEQVTHRIQAKTGVDMFNYRGELINELINPLTDTRVKNLIEHMHGIIVDNGLNIHGIEVPEYIMLKDMKKDGMIVKGFTNIEFEDRDNDKKTEKETEVKA